MRAVIEDRAPMIDGREGRKSLEVVIALYESAVSGRLIRV
jgi:UDP-N-acetyl-2-amino-2-deoxyglucuronate dehydrogenase